MSLMVCVNVFSSEDSGRVGGCCEQGSLGSLPPKSIRSGAGVGAGVVSELFRTLTVEPNSRPSNDVVSSSTWFRWEP